MSRKKFNTPDKNREDFYIRKDFYKRLGYTGICIILGAACKSLQGKWILAVWLFALIAIFQLIMIAVLSQLIIDDFFPPKIKASRPFSKTVNAFCITLIFATLIFLLLEIKHIENTINGTQLFWIAEGVGIGLAIILTVLLKLFRPWVYEGSNRRLSVHIGLFLALLLNTPMLASFINHYFADPNTFCKKHVIDRKSKGTGRSKECYFFIKVNNSSVERFMVSSTLYNNFKEHEAIELCMAKGKLGFDYVKEFKKTDNILSIKL